MNRRLVVPAIAAAFAVACGVSAENQYSLRLVAVDPAGGGDAALSPDGRRMVISSRRSGNWDLWSYDLEAETWTQLTFDAADDIEAQWSPDGRRLAFTSTRSGNKDVWVLSLPDGALTQLTDSPDEDEYPAWSPDGREIVYTAGPWKQRVFNVVSADGGESRRISPWPHQAGACSFRWDGRSLVCHGYDDGTGDVFELSLDGTIRPLTRGAGWDYKPTVMPLGEVLAFSRSDEGPSRVWLKHLPSGSEVPLTQAAADDRWPTWSASGTRLLFHRLVERGLAVRKLDRRTGTVETLVTADDQPLQASLHPSGQELAYAAVVGHQQRLFVRHLTHGTTRQLNTGAGEAAFPRWSPDGRRLAFALKNGETWEIATMDRSGANLRTWTRANRSMHGMNGPVDWSPGGDRLVFHADSAPFEANLFVLDLAAGSTSQLTSDAWFDEAPAWTPDGQHVTFMSTRGGDWTWGLFRLRVDGAGEAALMAGPDYTEKNYPRQSADGRTVWTQVDDGGRAYVVERSVRGEILRLTGTDGGRWPSYSADGRYVVFTAMERKVEYWLAEHVLGRGSPALTSAAIQPPPSTHCRRALPRRETTVALRMSPVAVHHR